MSCRLTSRDEFDRITPVSPPTVNRKTNPNDHSMGGATLLRLPAIVASHLNTFTPVGTAMIIVAAVK